MKIKEYLKGKSDDLRAKKLSSLIQEVSEPLMQDKTKKFQYLIGTVLHKAKEQAVAMETAVAMDNRPLRERSIANRIKSVVYSTVHKPVLDNENLYISDFRHWTNTSFMEQMERGFVNQRVKMITPEERKQEIERIGKMIAKICKANNLPLIEFDTFDRSGRIKGEEKKSFGAYSHEGRIGICPLYTKYESDNELAFELSHEIAHIVAGHTKSPNQFHNTSYVNLFFKSFNMNKDRTNDTLVKGLRRYEEYEADVLGVSFLRKAGFQFATDKEVTDKLKYSFLYYDNVHASPAERIAYVRDYDYSTLDFSYEKRRKEFEVLNDKAITNPKEVERYFMRKILKFSKIDNKLLMDRAVAIEHGTGVDKLKSLYDLTGYRYIKEKKEIEGKSNTLSRIYIYNEQKKDKQLREIGERIKQGISRMDYAKFYMQRIQEASKLEVAASLGHTLYAYANKKMNKGKEILGLDTGR